VLKELDPCSEREQKQEWKPTLPDQSQKKEFMTKEKYCKRALKIIIGLFSLS